MSKNINLSSTNKISDSELNLIVKDIAKYAQEKNKKAKKELDNKLKQEIKNAKNRFDK